jgi:hypothetical protein
MVFNASAVFLVLFLVVVVNFFVVVVVVVARVFFLFLGVVFWSLFWSTRGETVA